MSRRCLAAAFCTLALGVAALASGSTRAAFNSAAGNAASSYAAAPDFAAPSVTRTRVADPTYVPNYSVRQCRFYYAYAEVADTGNPASGVASVMANLTGLTAGVGADPLVAGSYSVAGVTYGYRGFPRLATAAPGNYLYDLTSTDTVGNAGVETGLPAAVVANTAPVAAVFLTGLEQGVASSAAPGVFDSITGTGVSADAAVRRNGSYSLRVAPANAAAYATATLPSSGSTVVVRFAVRLGSLPAGTVNLFSATPGNGAVGSYPILLYEAGTDRFAVRWGTSGTVVIGTVSPVAGTWYVVELRAAVTSTHTLEWRVDGVDQPTASTSQASTTLVGISLGTGSTSVTYTANFDDMIISRTAADYPIGNGKVLALAPNGMGTSLNPTYFRDNDGSSIDANSWARVDDVPATSTADFVKQTAANGTGYVEFTFANTAETCINAVGAVAAYHSSASGTNVGKTSVFNGTTESIVYSGSMGVTTLGYKRAVVSAGSGAWTSSLVNALKARVGYSTDSSPNPYWDALLLEYDVPLNW